MEFIKDNWMALLSVASLVIGFLGLREKLGAISVKVSEILHLTRDELNGALNEIDELISLLNQALQDNSISDDEVKAIVKEAKDIPDSVGVAIAKLKELLRN